MFGELQRVALATCQKWCGKQMELFGEASNKCEMKLQRNIIRPGTHRLRWAVLFSRSNS